MSTQRDKKVILQKLFEKLAKHIQALDDYKTLIDRMLQSKNIYDPLVFKKIQAQDRAVLDAYLKPFSAIQDFLGMKVFSHLFDLVGIPHKAMTEVLYHADKEGLIDSLESWIEICEVRNDLAHDYPDELAEALNNLKFCVDKYGCLKQYYMNTVKFANEHVGVLQ